LKKLQSGACTTQKKSPDQYNIDPGIALFYPQMTQVCPLSTGTAVFYSDRSSDSRIVLPVAPSQPKKINTVSGLVQRSSPVTAAGPSRIVTGFPFKLCYEHLKFFILFNEKSGVGQDLFASRKDFKARSTLASSLVDWRFHHHYRSPGMPIA